MKLEAMMVTDVGVVRDHNEDSAHIDHKQRFFIVADGMGGHAAGEVASAMAVETVKKTLEASSSIIDAFTQRPTDNARRALVQLLQSAVLAAHQAVYQRGSKESDKAGMGTTLDVLLIAGHEAFVAHVGDSRTYLIRDGKAAQLTTDHTVAEVLVIEGKLTIEEALVSPYRTVLVNAIGVAADVGVEMAHLQLRKGDKLLLCSDGLHDYFLAEQEIADTLGPADADGAAGDALGAMVETAKERGGHDNITGVVITVIEMSEAVPAVIEQDQTLPVDVPAVAWNDDERTENISPKDLDKLGVPPAMPPRTSFGGFAQHDDDSSRPTAPINVVKPPEPEGEVSGTESTDPKIELKRAGDDATEPALDASVVKAALARAQGSNGRPAGGEDPTDPGMDGSAVRAALGRASTAEPEADAAKDLAHDDTGPSPKVEGADDKADKADPADKTDSAG